MHPTHTHDDWDYYSCSTIVSILYALGLFLFARSSLTPSKLPQFCKYNPNELEFPDIKPKSHFAKSHFIPFQLLFSPSQFVNSTACILAKVTTSIHAESRKMECQWRDGPPKKFNTDCRRATQHHNRRRLGNGTDHTEENFEHSSIFGKHNQKYTTRRN
jgi:hypothetical protein